MGSGHTSSYHSLQTTVTKRLANHLSIQAFEVWARAMSSLERESTGPGGSTVQNAANLHEDRGRTDNDYRNVATIPMIWQPDYYAGQSRILRGLAYGWEISPSPSPGYERPTTPFINRSVRESPG